MTLSDRVFRCGRCGLVMDRDRNAAVNLAAWANAESSAGHRLGGGGTGPATAGEAPAKKQEPALLDDRA
jgi:putative transposase